MTEDHAQTPTPQPSRQDVYPALTRLLNLVAQRVVHKLKLAQTDEERAAGHNKEGSRN